MPHHRRTQSVCAFQVSRLDSEIFARKWSLWLFFISFIHHDASWNKFQATYFVPLSGRSPSSPVIAVLAQWIAESIDATHTSSPKDALHRGYLSLFESCYADLMFKHGPFNPKTKQIALQTAPTGKTAVITTGMTIGRLLRFRILHDKEHQKPRICKGQHADHSMAGALMVWMFLERTRFLPVPNLSPAIY